VVAADRPKQSGKGAAPGRVGAADRGLMCAPDKRPKARISRDEGGSGCDEGVPRTARKGQFAPTALTAQAPGPRRAP